MRTGSDGKVYCVLLESNKSCIWGARIGKDVQSAADALGVELLSVEAIRPDDFEGAFARIAGAQADALLVSADAFMFSNRVALVDMAARHKMPAVYPIREFAAGGGLVCYGTNYPEARRQVGDYLGRELNGERPENLPVRQVTKLKLVINMKTAKALGLAVPPSRPNFRLSSDISS